jgi:hypothetical protein
MPRTTGSSDVLRRSKRSATRSRRFFSFSPAKYVSLFTLTMQRKPDGKSRYRWAAPCAPPDDSAGNSSQGKRGHSTFRFGFGDVLSVAGLLQYRVPSLCAEPICYTIQRSSINAVSKGFQLTIRLWLVHPPNPILRLCRGPLTNDIVVLAGFVRALSLTKAISLPALPIPPAMDFCSIRAEPTKTKKTTIKNK